MRSVDEYKKHAQHCRALAARMTRPEDRVTLEEIAKVWEKVAGFVSAICTRLTTSFCRCANVIVQRYVKRVRASGGTSEQGSVGGRRVSERNKVGLLLRKFARSGTTRKPTPGTTPARPRLIAGSVAPGPPSPSPHAWGHGSHQIGHWSMNIERFAGHHEARQALLISVAGVTAIMLIANLILLLLY